MTKVIISNPNNIEDNKISYRKELKNYIFINQNRILLKHHHNSYYFIHEEDLEERISIKPCIIKKIYEEDYPLINDKYLLIKYYYVINKNIIIKDSIWIDIKDIKNVLKDSLYNNPRVKNITLELLEITEYLLTNLKDFS